MTKNQVQGYFFSELDKLIEEVETNKALQMIRLSILFEGFYRYLNDDELKPYLVEARSKRWAEHFGTPTITFLLSYKNEIEKTKQLFNELETNSALVSAPPWVVDKKLSFEVDTVDAPAGRETKGIFTKTHNPLGGFTTAACDPFSQQFIEQAAHLAKSGGKILEIGAGFGAATLEVLAKGATIFCNDIDPENLAVVQKRFQEVNQKDVDKENTKLVLIPGEFPTELTGLPNTFFDAILICRVLHFFTGKKIEESLVLISKLLAPGGKIYIVCETPYLKNWQRFIPEFHRRLDNNVEWPGEISDPENYENSGRAASLPKFVHWITKEVLERSLLRAGFIIENCSYINRAGQFPEDLLLPNYAKESVGAIGVWR